MPMRKIVLKLIECKLSATIHVSRKVKKETTETASRMKAECKK